jgi:hypothetical protein
MLIELVPEHSENQFGRRQRPVGVRYVCQTTADGAAVPAAWHTAKLDAFKKQRRFGDGKSGCDWMRSQSKRDKAATSDDPRCQHSGL